MALAKESPEQLTAAEVRQLVGLKKLTDRSAAPDLGGDPYAAHRERTAGRARSQSRSGRDIGPIPNVVDPKRRAAGLRSLKRFCEIYFPERFSMKWSPDHRKTLKKIQRAVLKGELRALSMPRGGGKTSLIEVAALWAIFKGVHRYVAIVAATAAKAVDILDSIKTELVANDALLDDFPEVCFPIHALENINQRARGQLCDGEPTRMTWQARKLILPTVKGSKSSGAILHAAGLTSGEIRGTKHTVRLDNGRTRVIRPSFVMIDDPQTDESAHSLTQNATREGLLAGAVLGMAGPGKKIAGFMLCTVIAQGDMADRILDRKAHPDWQGERFKMVYAWPAADKLWARYAEIRAESLRNELGIAPATEFYRKHRKKMDAGAKVAWAARFNEDELSALQHAMNLRLRDEAAFFAEYQNEPIVQAEETTLMPADEIAAKTNGYTRGTVPVGTEHLTAYIDCHDKLLYWIVAAWHGDFTGHVVDYGAYPDQKTGYFSLRNARKTLAVVHQKMGKEAAIFAGLETLTAELLGKTWTGQGGAEHRIGRLLVDAGYVRDVVYEFARTTRFDRVRPSHGRYIGAGRKPMAEYKRKRGDRLGQHWIMPALQKGESVRHVNIDVNWWKTFIHARLAVSRGDPGALTLFGRNPGTHRLLADHLLAEKPVQTEGPHGVVDEWHAPPDRPDNHWFDCLVGCAAAASVEGAELPGTGPSEVKTRRRGGTQSLAQLRAKAKGG